MTGSKPGHYFLDYSAAFGSSAVAQGALRVDVDPAQEDNRSPVAVPDKAVVRGPGPSWSTFYPTTRTRWDPY